MNSEELVDAAIKIANFARSLGVRGVIVAVNAGDGEVSTWEVQHRGPAFDVEGLARRLNNYTARIIHGAEAQANRVLDGPRPSTLDGGTATGKTPGPSGPLPTTGGSAGGSP